MTSMSLHESRSSSVVYPLYVDAGMQKKAPTVPHELWMSIFAEHVCPYLDTLDVIHVGSVCRTLRRVCDGPHVWRQLLQVQFRMSPAECQLLDQVATSVSRHGFRVPMEKCVSSYGPYRCFLDVVSADSCGSGALARVTHSIVAVEDSFSAMGSRPPTATTYPSRQLRCSPPRPISRDAASSIGGATPTPPRLRQPPSRGAVAPFFSVTPSPTQEVQVRARMQQLIRGATMQLPQQPSTPTGGFDSTRATAGWLEVDERPASEVPQRYAYRLETGLDETDGDVAPDRRTRRVQTPHVWHSQYGDDDSGSSQQQGEEWLDHIELEAFERSASPSTYGAHVLYDSGALYLGGDQFSRFSELWDAQQQYANVPRTTSVTHLAVDHQSLIWRSGSLASCFPQDDFGAQRVTSPLRSTALSTTSIATSIVCARTAMHSLCGSAHPSKGCYPFKQLYATIYSARVKAFLMLLESRRIDALRAISCGPQESALQLLSSNISNIIEGGCAKSNEIREELVKDLLLRGRHLRSMLRDDEALGDFSLAFLLSPTCEEAYIEASIISTSSSKCSANVTRILSPNFSLDDSYDALLCEKGSIGERAAFLFEVLFWRGPSLMLLLYQYMLCDAVKVLPTRLLIAASAQATSTSDLLIVRAWILFDAGEKSKAAEAAEMAVSLLPAEASRITQETEQLCVEIAHSILLGDDMWQRAPPELQAACLTVRRIADVSSAALLIPSFSNLLTFWSARCSSSGGRQHRPKLHTASAFAFFSLAFMSSDFDVAMDAYRRYIFSSPPKSRLGTAYNNVAFLLLRHPDMSACAEVLFERATEVFPAHIVAKRNLARCYYDSGHVREAFELISSIVVDGKAVADTCAEALFERAKMSARPMDDLMEATRRDPRYAQPYRLRAALAMDRGDPAAAIAELDAIVSVSFDAPELALRALFRRDSGDLDGAVRDMALACCLAPERSDLRTTLCELIAAADESARHRDTELDEYFLSPPPERNELIATTLAETPRGGQRSGTASRGVTPTATTPVDQLMTGEAHGAVSPETLYLTPSNVVPSVAGIAAQRSALGVEDERCQRTMLEAIWSL